MPSPTCDDVENSGAVTRREEEEALFCNDLRLSGAPEEEDEAEDEDEAF